jgi:NADH dehydrogenase FAD-containing subunit
MKKNKGYKMNNIDSRRDFIKIVGLGSLVTLFPLQMNANTIPHVVIVGGGFSGATCAKYLKLWGGSSIDVTIVESNTTYTSPILSNLVLNGQKNTDDLSFNYQSHNVNYNINIVHKTVTAVNNTQKTITLSDSSTISYDKLVLAGGIDFTKVNNYDFAKVPHAWGSKEQIELLKTQIDTMVDGDDFIMSIPAAPYRCPPGPYERACVVADYLKNTKGFTNSKVIVLDANSDIIVEKDTFSSAFTSYGVDYKASCTIDSINDSTMEVTYTKNSVQNTIGGKVLNIIPNQKAASIVFTAGVNSGNFAPVNPLSYESIIKNNIYIIGDSQATAQPKAGHIGNSEAKICADAILRTLNSIALNSSPKTNSACYSPTSSNSASWLTAVFKYDTTSQSMVVAHSDAGASSTANYSKMFLWSGNLFSDTFG